MKISDSLLKSIAVGIALSSVTSCGLAEDRMVDIGHNENCEEGCIEVHEGKQETERCLIDCGPCGMG